MRKYQSYKPSGVEWIGEIPEHWNSKRICFVFRPISIKNNFGEINLSVYRDYGVIPTDSRDDNHNTISEDTSNYKLVQIGDFVMNKMKCWMGSLGLSDYRGIVSPSYTVMRPISNENRKYLHYLLRSQLYIPQYRKLSYGVRVGQWDMRFEDFRELPCILPPIYEQDGIVEFLDSKTELIDKLISTKERKITLLKEQRTSLINQVVTKGLNPNVKMKDSGVEWIGEIPEDWKFIKFSYLISKSDLGGNYESSTEGDGVPLMKMGNLGRGQIVLNKIEYLNSLDVYDTTHKLEYGDFLFNTRNSIDLVGKVSLWRNELDFSLYNSNILRISFKNGVDNEFMCYLFNSQSILDVLKIISKGTTSVSGIYYKDLSEIKLCIPSIEEQLQIVEYLNSKTKEIDELVQLEQKKIDLLKVYRQSLISEVVTGKIKVTN